MPDQSARSGSPVAPTSKPYNSAVETILRDLFPMYSLAETAAVIAQATGHSAHNHTQKVLEEVATQRAKLLALQEPELRKLHQQVLEKQKVQQAARAAADKAKKEAKKAAKEAAQFYNQSNAQADFTFWMKAEYWTFDEALALLLARNPKVVTWAAMKSELEPGFDFLLTSTKRGPLPNFVRSYQQLRILAERSSAMKPSQLNPAEVVAWAHRIQAVDIPPALQSLLPKSLMETSRGLEMQSITMGEQSLTSEVQAMPSEGTTKKWTPERLQELSAYRDQNGTKATAIRFGISDTRVRQLLPQLPPKPKGYSAFNQKR